MENIDKNLKKKMIQNQNMENESIECAKAFVVDFSIEIKKRNKEKKQQGAKSYSLLLK